MAGLDKMIDQILEEANNSVNAKLDEAKSQADEIMETARQEAAKEVEEIGAKASQDSDDYLERMKSSADLKHRTNMLQAKQETISGILDKAYEKFCSQDQDAYFATLLNMLKKFALDQDGTIYLSDQDLAVLPRDFKKKAAKIAADKGGTIKVSKKSRPIDKGFILAYGDIEENCSFRALFDSQKDELQDKVQTILFS